LFSGSCYNFFFILICNPVLVLAGDCVQKRETPQAPSKIYKQTNPLEVTPEIISAGKKLYTKGAKPLACFQCHGINKFLP
jgi:hypothetical protein|tara:strand:+ start:598 stop:837 length:240 start_codon:yes stop_codon:yes gene_type:complete